MNLSEMEDWEFSKTWVEMSIDDKAALPDDDRKFFVERYRALTAYMNDAARRFKKGNGDQDYDPGPVPEESIPQTNLIDWNEFTGDPPPREWIIPHWLGWNPTLLAGRGGIGKSLMIQQTMTQLATSTATWGGAREPLRVLYWACEDDKEELRLRQHFICKNLKLPFSSLGNLQTDARLGLENTLMETSYGKLMFAPAIEVLRQELNDLQIDVLALDNISHTFGGNENSRHEVTTFINKITGLVCGRRFCPILLGHVSKSEGSQFSGSTAWETGVRMRWFFDDKMPDVKSDDDAPIDENYRVLAKRKTNYSRTDYIEFRYHEGNFIPVLPETTEPGLMAKLHQQKALRVVLSAVNRLKAMGMRMAEGSSSPQYLPKLIIKFNLNEGCIKAELDAAMRTAMLEKKIIKGVVGTYPNRSPMEGLCLSE